MQVIQEQLLEKINILPIDLKNKIDDKVLNSINPIPEYIDNLWLEKVNKRKDDIEYSNVDLIKGNDVFIRIFERLNNK